MAPVFCPRCQRANPPDAAFCHFDGVSLRAGAVAMELGREFVLPGGRRCHTFDDLVAACSDDWSAARQLLKSGGFKQFFASIGRLDLAVAADKAAARDDLDLGLDQLLTQFPCKVDAGPKLDLAPRRIQISGLPAGQARDLTVTIFNQGKRLLHGTLEVRGGDWVRVEAGTSGSGNGKVPIKAGRSQQLQVHISTQGLPAGQRYAATLTLITNGGAAELPITVDVVPVPFPEPPLQGACTPKELATAMKEAPKPASLLLENGQIERWFSANGWRYPVVGSLAKGVAAVQQFFEALGLSKPPPLTLVPDHVELAVENTAIQGSFELTTSAKKWVYARVETDQPWLRPVESTVSGPVRATVGFEVVPRRLPGRGLHEGALHLLGNGNQRLRFRVKVYATATGPGWLRRTLRTAAAGLFLGLCLRLLCVPLSLLAGLFPGPMASEGWFALLWAPLGAVAGAWAMARYGESWSDIPAGLVAGALGGLVGGATLANALRFVDSLAGELVAQLLETHPGPQSPWPGLVAWSILGLVAAVLWRLVGSPGISVTDPDHEDEV